MGEWLINYFDKFGPELLIIQFGVFIILLSSLIWLWFYNRRKYHNLTHAIPASVVKSYLDSIIQNSSALKSSLFRGGGGELGIPSVLPSHQLSGGDNIAVSGTPSAALLEELNQKKAIIASLEAQISAGKNAQRALEAQIAQLQAEVAGKNARIKELEDLLAKARATAGTSTSADTSEMQSELQEISRERDELKDRLKEFEIISDDLADLKRLQQENEQLKRSLAAKGGPSPASSSAVPEALTVDKVEDIFSDVNSSTSSTNEDISAFEDFIGGNDAQTPPSNEVAETNFEDFGSSNDENNTISGGSQDLGDIANSISGGSAQEEISANSLDDINQNASSAENQDSSGPTEVSEVKQDKTSEDLLSEFEKMLG